MPTRYLGSPRNELMNSKKTAILLLSLLMSAATFGQVGSHRNDFAVGFNGGYTLNSISFVPKVPQKMLGGKTFGVTARYVCEKYFNTICAVQLEVNYAELGWREDILSVNDEPCKNNVTGLPEEYERRQKYIQMPVLAHLGFGREVSGAKFFVNLGPQFGLNLSEKTTTNFDISNAMNTDPSRVSSVIAQDTMKIERKFDYGITAGLGMEYSLKRSGHILLEARYYYGLGSIFSDSKADYFSRSNHNTIIFKATYLFDLIRTKNAQRK